MNAIVLACLVFCLGLYGVLARREIIAVLASVEVMLGGATLLLVSLGVTSVAAVVPGAGMAAPAQSLAVLLLAIVASEAAVGLALLVALVRRGRTRMSEIEEVRG